MLLLALPAEETPPSADTLNRAKLSIVAEALGDTDAGVVIRTTFRFTVPSDVPSGTPLVIQGSVGQAGKVIRTFRYPLLPDQLASGTITSIQTVPAGEIELDARLMVPLEEEAPVIVGKTSTKTTIAAVSKPYVATESDGAEAILAEGIVPESTGAVRILPPRRDLAPNLFIVDVDVKEPVKRLEFYVEGKKILVRNAPPYRAELDLGKLPKRVEVRVVGFDARNRYIDADAFIVNERETPLEVKITRTIAGDVSHVKLSVQNPKSTALKTVALFAGQKKIFEWSRPPYAITIPNERLKGVDFLRASVIDSTDYEAADLLFLDGTRFMEEIEVHLVELPVSVSDVAGNPIIGLKQENFQVLENGKPQRIGSFHFAANLPLSVGLLIDHSGSMQPRIKAVKEAANEFFSTIMKPQDRAFVGGFAFDATKLAPFVTDTGSLRDQVTALPEAVGGTSLYDAIVTGLYRFRSIQGRRALIILSDGEDTTSRVTYDDMLLYVRAARVPLYFIGVGLGFGDIGGTSKMKTLAAETGGVAYFVKDVKELKETYKLLENELRSQYLLSYHAESTRKDQKYRTVEVKVDRPDARVRTIRGYIP